MRRTKSLFVFFLIMTGVCTLVTSCKKDDDTQPGPVINGFTPESAGVGQTVTISGENFRTTASENIVEFNGVATTVSEATATSLTVTVPEGTTTGKITVTVNGRAAESDNVFTILSPPVISGFTPESAGVGQTVTISGENFSTTASENSVKFNGVAATVSGATATSLTVTVPDGATTGKIAVTVYEMTAESDNEFTLLPTPVISGFSPENGGIGYTVTISGENFSTTASENTVEFNGVAATVSGATATSLTVTVPDGATTGKITVTVNEIIGTSTKDFTVWENYALNATATASSTCPGYSPSNVNDNSLRTDIGSDYSWTNENGTLSASSPQWVQLTFDSGKKFSKVVIYTTNSLEIGDFQIQYWDGSDWVSVASVSGNTETILTFEFDEVESDKIRLSATRGSSNQPSYARVNEFQVWGVIK